MITERNDFILFNNPILDQDIHVHLLYKISFLPNETSKFAILVALFILVYFRVFWFFIRNTWLVFKNS